MTPEWIDRNVRDARERTFEIIADLDDEQLIPPRLEGINPFLWEIGHVAFFQERFVLRREGKPSIRSDAEALWDSIAIPQVCRWDLPVPSREETLAYMRGVRDGCLERLHGPGGDAPEELYYQAYALFHEDMHDEAFLYTRQALGLPAPELPSAPAVADRAGPLPGDVEVPGGRYRLGAEPEGQFVFDNEKWAHDVELAPFSIARAPVTQGEFAAFVDDGGYERPELWTAAGWAWRTAMQVDRPLYWRRGTDGWERRAFDRWVPLEPHHAMVHVSRYEAEAYCEWAGRRLPTEAEWEVAASWDPATGTQRRMPWADGDLPDASRANVDHGAFGTVDVGALPAGESPLGCRHMIGNVWEWTDTVFEPYPGFELDPYREYSSISFYTHRVLRGGCWASRGRLLRNSWRNFFMPFRRDVFAGFRTCRR